MRSRVNTLNRLVAARRERVPRGQKLTEKFPVLDLGVRLAFHEKRWRFTVDGEVEEPDEDGHQAAKDESESMDEAEAEQLLDALRDRDAQSQQRRYRAKRRGDDDQDW